MSRTTIHVTPRSRGRWAVMPEENSRASVVRKDKSSAVKKAKRKAKKKKPSELVIHRSDGSIQKKHSYGSDPTRYPG